MEQIIARIDFWALIVAVASVIWTYLNSRKLNRQQIQLNQINIEKAILEKQEKDYADIKITVSKITRTKSNTAYRLEITNVGPGKATNVGLLFNQELAQQKGLHIDDNEGSLFPLLNKDDSFTRTVYYEEGHANLHMVKIKWDDSRIGNIKDQALEFS